MTKFLILLIDDDEDLVSKVKEHTTKTFEITEQLDIQIKYIYSLPRDDGDYSLEHLSDYVVITDYYGVKSDTVRRVDDITDVQAITEIVASYFITPKVYYTDCPIVTKRWLSKLPSEFSYDSETEGLAIKDVGKYTMHSFSIDLVKSIVIIDTPETRPLVIDFLVSTEKKIIIHNAAFDLRAPYRWTGKFPKDYEDTMLMAQAHMNHTGLQAYSLKTLAGGLYGDWATAKTSFLLYEDSTHYNNPNLTYFGNNPDILKYNLPLIYYAGIDSSACLYVFSKFRDIHPTWESVEIENLLPIQEPRYHEETPRYFYENVMKPLIKTTIELLETPMPIDMNIVEEIKQEALAQREPAFAKLQEFPKVIEYMSGVKAQLVTDFLTPLQEQKDGWLTKVFKHNVKDRTLLCNSITGENRESWKVTDLKEYQKTTGHILFESILNKDVGLENNPLVIEVMSKYRSIPQQKLQHKLDNPLEYIEKKKLTVNPNASQQMKGLYKFLGLTSDVLTPKKEESFSKDVIKEIAKTTSDNSVREIIGQVLLIADTKNLLSQYIKGYEHSNINGFCYQSLRFPGTISMRVSGAVGKVNKSDISQEPLSGFGASMVTQPGVTKRAVVAPEGFLIATSDYNGLENNISANLTHDPTQIKVLTDNYDMHSLHASYYFTEEIEKIIGKPFVDTFEMNQELNILRKTSKQLDKLRSAGKSVTFGISYGAYPPKIAKSLKQPLEVGQALFDRFHNDMYPTVKDYRELYILPKTKSEGKIHLGLGATLSSNKPDKDIRSLSNATFQFWSILTLLAIYKIKQRIVKVGYQEDIRIYSTIHDSITAYIKKDPVIIKWYNDNLVECMIEDFVVDQSVVLQANLDIGSTYAIVKELPNNCSTEEIQQVIDKLNN